MITSLQERSQASEKVMDSSHNIANETVAAQRQAVLGELAQGIAQDVFAMYANALQREAGISLNQQAIAAVHAQFP